MAINDMKTKIMEQLITASVTVDADNNVISYNNDFKEIFLNKINVKQHLTIDKIIACSFNVEVNQKTALLINNNFIDHQDMLGYFYIHIRNLNNTYQIKFINWCNWIANLYGSLNSGYSHLVKLNDNNKMQLEYSSDIHAFNALYPLLMHKPHDFIKQINTHAFYGILRKFINRRDTDHINKDYAYYTYRRLETSIKEQTGGIRMEIDEIMRQRELLNFRHMSQIYIPNTKIKENIILDGYNDKLLDLFLCNISA